MAMNITRISPVAGVAYLTNTILHDDGIPTAGAAGYYNAPGNTPGVWLGSGLDALNITEGMSATKRQAVHLFNHLQNIR